jgi:hypothetical protein
VSKDPAPGGPVRVLVGLVAAALILAVLGQGAAHLPGGRHALALVFFGGLFTVGLAACAMVAAAMWPGPVSRAHDGLAAHPLRCGLIGLLIVLGEVFLVVHGGRPVLLACLLLDLVWLAQGLPALTALMGERLGASSRPRAVAQGSLLFGATGILPVIGWLLGLTLLMQALGAAVLPVRPAATTP